MERDGSSGARRLSDLISTQEGAVVSRMLAKQASGNVTLFAFGKGEGLSEHTTPHEAVLVGVEGEAEVTIGGNAGVVRAGEVITLPAGIPHAILASEDFKMLLIMLKA